jgi:L-ascorbate metabolism protein UlaG (beta-lactamase superfamily)
LRVYADNTSRMKKFLKRFITVTLVVIAVLFVTTILYMRLDKFGKASEGDRLEAMKKSSNFNNGKFENINLTPDLTNGHTMLDVMYTQFFNGASRRTPIDVIPSVKTDLFSIPIDSNVLIWFGHSSYLVQIDGKRILVDPVFSGNASPIPGTVPSFTGTDIYSNADFPPIDYLLISHDHYDHVDYETLIGLREKIRKVICGLGVGSHFEQWGYDKDAIIETDWHEEIKLDSGFTVFTEPARHFSGRGFSRNNTLWQSYLVQTPTMKFYVGGDSGYDTHFQDIGSKYGPIDLVMLDNGQYDEAWQLIHTLPHEVLQAAKDLKAKRLFPVHSSKFVLANHAWDEPLTKITELNKKHNIPLVTPMIGEIVNLNDSSQQFKQWWVGVN